MERVRGGSREGTGRPHNEGASQSKVTVFLGRDEDAREVKRTLEDFALNFFRVTQGLKFTD